jgi:hypothetical protein
MHPNFSLFIIFNSQSPNKHTMIKNMADVKEFFFLFKTNCSLSTVIMFMDMQ